MESKLKHLEFIQNVIARMSSNSALMKGWSVTLLAAMFALATKDSRQAMSLLVFIPISAFWGLDAYYLSLERQFRDLFETVAATSPEQIAFTMKPPLPIKEGNTLICCIFNGSVFCFHGVLAILILILMVFVPALGR